MDSADYKSCIFYYGRLRFYNLMQKTALEGLTKFPAQSEFRLFNGIALALSNQVHECIRELNPLKNDLELGSAAIMTLIYAHKHCRVIDIDAIQNLELRIFDGNVPVNSISYYYIAVFLFLTEDFNAALDYIKKSLKVNNADLTLILKSWCEISSYSYNQTNIGKMQNLIEECISRSNGKNIDATLALVNLLKMQRQFKEALVVINKLSARFSELNITLIEKMKIQLASLDWDNTLDTANRILNLEPTNLSALRTKGVLHIVHESNFEAGINALQQLLRAMDRIEPRNQKLLIEICQLYSRICSKNYKILQITFETIDKVNKANSGDMRILTELGYQNILLNNILEAENNFRSACNIDSTNFDALCGLTFCKLYTCKDFESMKQIQQQLDYLTKLNCNKSEPTVMYMSALLNDGNVNQLSTVNILIKAADLQIQKFTTFPFGVKYIYLMNLDLMLTLCEALIRHIPPQISETQYDRDLCEDTLNNTLKQITNILEIVLRMCPGHQQALFLQSKTEFLCGDYSNAISHLQNILILFGDEFLEAHMLLAQIFVLQKKHEKALDCIERSLAQSFKVREWPMYHLLKGIILRYQKKISDAHNSLLLALHLVDGSLGFNQIQNYLRTENLFTNSDKLTLYIELIYVLREMGDTQSMYESERIVLSALEEFNGSNEMGRLVIAHSNLLLEKCNITEAISILSKIKPSEAYYIQVRTHLANIYLYHQKDRIAYSNSLNELIEARPEQRSFLTLGEAYLSIQEIEKAIKAFKNGFNIFPSNLMARRLGRAYVKSHQYARALKYYHEQIKNPDLFVLKLDLAELFLQLKQFQSAANVLIEKEKIKKSYDELSEIQFRTKKLLLLARIYEKSGNFIESLKTLQDARENQYRGIKLCSVHHSESISKQSKMLSKICILIAKHALRDNNIEIAYQQFEDCLKYTPGDIDILVSLANLQMDSKELDMCRNTCTQILKIDCNNIAASLLMADISFRKMEFKLAAYHFSQILLSQPRNWKALIRLTEVMRRTGSLFEILPFLHRAEQSNLQSKELIGLNYCKGLFEWYSGNLNTALQFFNISRRDNVLGQQTKLNMIEICINPDGEIPYVNDLYDTGDSVDFNESRIIALQTAERLLKELRTQPGEKLEAAINRRVLWNTLQMASNQKYQVEFALKDLTELLQSIENTSIVSIVYAMSIALVQLKQVQRAKTQLKRISRINWSYEDAEYLERSWLLLADIYIHSNKLDTAKIFISRVLEYNKSSTKAYELSGYVAEKLQCYDDATIQYQKAWDNCGHSKPHIGFKLALNNMKVKKYASAVDICQQVLKMHPDYTIIRKDILEKCRSNLRA